MNKYIKEYPAYCKWLLQSTDNNNEYLSAFIYNQLVQGNDMAFKIVFYNDEGYGSTMELINSISSEIIETYSS